MWLLYHKHSIIEWVNIKQQSHYISFWLAWCYDYHYHYHLPLPFIFNSSLQIHVCFAKAANIFCLIFIIHLAAVKLKGLIHNHNNVIGLVWYDDYFYYLPLPFTITIYHYHVPFCFISSPWYICVLSLLWGCTVSFLWLSRLVVNCEIE